MKFVYIFLAFLFIGCGYKPSSLYTKRVLGKNIHVDAKISRKDPKNSVLIKDAISEAIVDRFSAKLSGKQDFDTEFNVSINSVNFIPTVYNRDGYVISYKTRIVLNINYKDKNSITKNFLTEGEYNFPIEANSVISDTKRFEAIKNAAKEAVDGLISKISVIGIMSGDSYNKVLK